MSSKQIYASSCRKDIDPYVEPLRIGTTEAPHKEMHIMVQALQKDPSDRFDLQEGIDDGWMRAFPAEMLNQCA